MGLDGLERGGGDMTTRKDILSNLNQKRLSLTLLEECIYCVNKRAKNYRDKEDWGVVYNQYFSSFTDAERKAWKYIVPKEQMQRYYEMKETLLSPFEPHLIQVTTSDPSFLPETHPQVIKEDVGMEMCQDIHEKRMRVRNIHRRRMLYAERLKPDYHLLYQVGTHRFHLPVDQNVACNFKDLEQVEVQPFRMKGKPIKQLVDMQVVHEVLDLIESEDYQIVA
jgi:hypothetical protein